MRRITLVSILAMLLACSPLSLFPRSTPSHNQDPSSNPNKTPFPQQSGTIKLTDTQDVVDKMEALCCSDDWWTFFFEAENKASEALDNGEEIDIGAVFLENLEAAGEKFDPNNYFDVLTHLTLEEGYVLDYVYFSPGGDGFPYVYARPEEAPPFPHYSAFQESNSARYFDHIQVDGSTESYFELAVLDILGEQFYLAWHAEYDDWKVINSQERLEGLIQLLNEEHKPLTSKQESAVRKLDVTPDVKIMKNKVEVRIVVFTKWGGFYERIYTINKDFPHQITFTERELVPYECGIMF